jgi:CRISPR-associated protein Cst2
VDRRRDVQRGLTGGHAVRAEEGEQPVPYGTEVHATRYQYGIALTPERLRDQSRAAKAIDALCKLGTVAGNHGRFLYDFSPDAVVFRITHDPAPRLLYCFDTPDNGKTVVAPRLEARVADGDIDKGELVIAGVDVKGIVAEKGVKAACAKAVERITAALKTKG